MAIGSGSSHGLKAVAFEKKKIGEVRAIAERGSARAHSARQLVEVADRASAAATLKTSFRRLPRTAGSGSITSTSSKKPVERLDQLAAVFSAQA